MICGGWGLDCGLLGFEGCFIGWLWVVVDGGRGFLWLVVLQGYGGGCVVVHERETKRGIEQVERMREERDGEEAERIRPRLGGGNEMEKNEKNHFRIFFYSLV